LNGEFIAALLRDFRQGGPKAIERVRRTQPAAYMKILALLIPREHKVEHTNPMAELSDDQLASMIEHVRGQLEERLRSERVAKVIGGRAVALKPEETG
jgi:hypothetical protein